MKPTRRQWMQTAAAGTALSLSGNVRFPNSLLANESESTPFGKAEHVISIWLGGGMGQIDTFDPKRVGDPKAKKPGSLYRSIDTAVPGVSVCEYLPMLAERMDRVTAVRTVHHDVIDEHAAATNRMHTGRIVTGTVTYPSLGSTVAHELGAADDGVPPYVLIGYPNVTRGPGFLGASAGYLYLTDTSKGPAGLSLPYGVDNARQEKRKRLLSMTRQSALQRFDGDPSVADYDSAIQQSLKLSGPDFGSVFELNREPDSLRNQYGSEFGQRCLLSRRLIQRGVRFVEVSHNLNFINGTGWDVHNDGIEKQHELIQDLDTSMATLMDDLDQHGLLDKTLIMVSSEFGRPPGFDSGGGRGHQGKTFTCVLAGGGLNHSGAFGVTDELSQNIVESPVGVPDLFATVHASLGIDPNKLLYDGDRPIPITDNGKPIRELLV
ncbi:DUF1501 domain-containing protein [Rhodopirellula sp. JC740]|uniref:DUF1501 domain-containing protein n=1 Tax=Rhodopirellula halodulae TaxID=2894198 RepID=A0ABS8NMH0_9BACT|nr:DUF1501 domain-containing protein [Rhodopirellula sp. JC740]MCC9644706.1 DUF1501 domain-containing protein [Rhodopirellula sp. JC740]